MSSFDKETGALSRDCVNYNSELDKKRGYGKTAELDSHPLLKPQISIIAGNTGGGKSNLALNLLDEIHKTVNPKRLGRIMYYSGSPSDPLLQKLDPKAVTVYTNEQTQSLLDELRALKLQSRHIPEDDLPLTVLVLDDAGSNKDLMPSQVKGSEMGEILIGHRHVGLHVIMLVQRLKGFVSPFVLANFSQLFLFPMKNKDDQNELLRNVPFPQEQISKFLTAISTQPYEFLWLNMKAKSVQKGFSDTILS